jgi:hypothetical protein
MIARWLAADISVDIIGHLQLMTEILMGYS